jgi:hypothetical protein
MAQVQPEKLWKFNYKGVVRHLVAHAPEGRCHAITCRALDAATNRKWALTMTACNRLGLVSSPPDRVPAP